VSENFYISVILATYNWPQALHLCLQGLECQTDNYFEVVIADDGSREDTLQFIKGYIKSSHIKISHIWHPDHGFRKSMILNKAIALSSGKYLLFLDGDCIVQPDFIAKHRLFSENAVMVTGSRILLGESLTHHLCKKGKWSYNEFLINALRNRISGELNKLLPLLFKIPDNALRMYSHFEWRRIKGCNMAAWRQDVLGIQGFDEHLQGWGHEDADFVFRLQRSGIKRKSGAWATEVLHLWHPSASKENSAKNAEIVRAKILAK